MYCCKWFWQYSEFRCCFDRQLFGPDAKASLTIRKRRISFRCQKYSSCWSNPIDKIAILIFELQNFEKSLAVNKNCLKYVITFDDLWKLKKPKGWS
jgi:N-acetylneuraminate synthase